MPVFVQWGKRKLPQLKKLWNFYSGKSGIGRFVQTSFLFYGGMTTLFLTFFAIRFNVFDGTLGAHLVGNLAFIGFGQIPGGSHPVLGLPDPGRGSAGSRLDDRLPGFAGHDLARMWPLVKSPKIVVYRNPKGTFTRSVTAVVIAAVMISSGARARPRWPCLFTASAFSCRSRRWAWPSASTS